MRIAIDTLYEHPDRPTGSLDYLRLMARELPRYAPQHQFYLLTSPRNVRHFEEMPGANLRLVRCACSNENLPLRILEQQTVVPWLLRKHKIDLLYAPGNVGPLWWNGVCCVLKINTLHHYHTPGLIGRPRAAYRKRVFAASARRAARVIANTELTKREIHEFMGIPQEKISVVAEPVYDSYASITPERAESVLRRHGLTRKYILFVSTLYPYKNAETLIEAFARLKHRSGAGCDLVVVGRDFADQLPKLKALASRLGLNGSVRFLGFVPAGEMPSLYSQASAFIFPSLVETFGKPLVEAMQCGAPVVASNTSCMPEVLAGAGLLVNPLDASEMAAAISRASEEGPFRDALVARSLARGRQFSSAQVAQETLSVIEGAYQEHFAVRGARLR